MLISITGKLGSGKSTICNILKEKYGFEIFSTGTINREFARSLGITTLELNERLKEDPALDKEIDGTVTRLSIEKKDEKLIFDSRMAWHFAKDTFKIFLTLKYNVNAYDINTHIADNINIMTKGKSNTLKHGKAHIVFICVKAHSVKHASYTACIKAIYQQNINKLVTYQRV